jgi:hypothetical protein
MMVGVAVLLLISEITAALIPAARIAGKTPPAPSTEDKAQTGVFNILERKIGPGTE